MATQEKVNILLVDDQPGKLLSYEVMLAELGENLIKSSSASEALAHLLRQVRLDLFPNHPVALQQRVTLRPKFGMRMIVRRRAV